MNKAISSDIYFQVEKLANQFHTATPFPHVVIDNFLTESIAKALVQDFPPISAMRRSNHYLFANKYELPEWQQLSDAFGRLYHEVISTRFNHFISSILKEEILIDPEFCGDLQQGKDGSFLEMHVDFNVHPRHQNWLHCLNILIYLNQSWQQQYGGDLELRLGLNGSTHPIAPTFNRCVILLSNDQTYHGYRKTSLPDRITRKAILIHGYKPGNDKLLSKKLTSFAPDNASILKAYLANFYNFLSSTKGQLFGSSLSALSRAKRILTSDDPVKSD